MAGTTTGGAPFDGSAAAPTAAAPAFELATKRLLLRDMVDDDAAPMNSYESLPDVVRYTSHGALSLEESLGRIRSAVEAGQATPRRVFDLAVVLRETSAVVGRAGFRVNVEDGDDDPEHVQADLWYILHPDYWRRGLATEACRALLAFLFDTLRVHRVAIDYDPRNEASARVGDALGMTREAVLRKNVWLKGEWCDSAISAILRDEYAGAHGSDGGPAATASGAGDAADAVLAADDIDPRSGNNV